MKKQKASRIQLNVGIQSFGSSTTIIASDRVTLEILPMGVLVTNNGTLKVKTLIPFSNCKAIDFKFTDKVFEDEDESPKQEVELPKPAVKQAKPKKLNE